MRKIGSFADESSAARFIDYLVTLEIAAQSRRGDDAWGVWIDSERDLETARRELATFQADPGASRYDVAQGEAQALREARAKEQKKLQKNARRQRGRWAARGENTVTIVLLVLSVAISIATGFGDRGGPLLENLSPETLEIAGPGLAYRVAPFPEEVLQGEVWRLLTPIFLHFGVFHLFFNMNALLYFGSMIEMRRGWRYFVVLVLALALLSNLAQTPFSVRFGGMSGVVYGLFGFVWMRMRYQGNEGFYVHPTSVFIMMAWFVLGFLNLMPIANAAHAGGLILGLVIGAAPFWWNKLRGTR